MRKLRLVFHACCTALVVCAASAAPLELKLVGVDGKGIGGTVVVLRSTDRARPVAKPVDAKMDQIDRRFVPNLLIVPTGSKIAFPNSDIVRHQVYSFSPTHKFSLPLYTGTPRAEVFDMPGLVTLGCNIHDNMRALVFVVDAHYFGRADSSGTWKADVQPGTYTVQIWHPLARNQRPVIEQQITVSTTDPHVTLRLAAALRLRNEPSEIPGNWDAY